MTEPLVRLFMSPFKLNDLLAGRASEGKHVSDRAHTIMVSVPMSWTIGARMDAVVVQKPAKTKKKLEMGGPMLPEHTDEGG